MWQRRGRLLLGWCWVVWRCQGGAGCPGLHIQGPSVWVMMMVLLLPMFLMMMMVLLLLAILLGAPCPLPLLPHLPLLQLPQLGVPVSWVEAPLEGPGWLCTHPPPLSHGCCDGGVVADHRRH